jgi:signal peptidase II
MRDGDLTETNKTDRPGRKSSFGIWAALAALVVLFDQLTKWAILQFIEYGDPPEKINSFLQLTHRRNTGAAFSFLADGGGWQRWFFIGLAAAVSAVIAVWLWRLRSAGQTVLSAGLALVLGGALGNVIDRIRLGYVIDFIEVPNYFAFLIGGTWFPAFNVADSAITVGAVLLIIDALFLSGRQRVSPAPTPAPNKKEG